MKRIIQRNLPLNVKYSLVGITYMSLEDGGCTCENCGKLISNIATVKSDKGTYQIGTDCLETLQENNSFLNNEDYFNYQWSDKPAIQKAKSLRAKIIKAQKTDPSYSVTKEVFANSETYGYSFERDGKPFSTLKEWKEPLGWDYTLPVKYMDLIDGYIKNLPNVTL